MRGRLPLLAPAQEEIVHLRILLALLQPLRRAPHLGALVTRVRDRLRPRHFPVARDSPGVRRPRGAAHATVAAVQRSARQRTHASSLVVSQPWHPAHHPFHSPLTPPSPSTFPPAINSSQVTTRLCDLTTSLLSPTIPSLLSTTRDQHKNSIMSRASLQLSAISKITSWLAAL
jgi:hypothetical protein